MDGFVLFCLSIFHCNFFSPFLRRKAIISITLYISAKFVVSVHAWPKGRKSHSVGVEFHFLSYSTHSFFSMICSWCRLTMQYIILRVNTIWQYSAVTAVIEIWFIITFVYMHLPGDSVQSEEMFFFCYAFKLNHNGGSTLDHQKTGTFLVRLFGID